MIAKSRKFGAWTRPLVTVALILIAAACTSSARPAATFGRVAALHGKSAVQASQRIDEILARHRIVTAGIGLIRDGKLAWSDYFGDQSPGVRASARTRFNVASITKTVTAETVLRLVAQGRLSLDEPMAPYWVDPDVAGDPRHLNLTPRMVLNHTTGFPNWRFFRRGGKLAFERTPGESYGYSGEGFDYVARYAERKLELPFPRLVAETVLAPVGMTNTAVEVHRKDDRIARPVDEQGVFHGYYCRPEGARWCRGEGSYVAADDMVTTVADYAAFLVSVMTAGGYGPTLAAERDRVQTDKGAERVVRCDESKDTPCPIEQGYGLGFNVLKYDGLTVVGHSGSDWSEVAIAYYYSPSNDGIIVFLNAPNRRALAAMPEMLELLDPASPFLPEYRRWLAAARQEEKTAK
jgi:CubicO group peptidase (beta-lactamase class C family)